MPLSLNPEGASHLTDEELHEEFDRQDLELEGSGDGDASGESPDAKAERTEDERLARVKGWRPASELPEAKRDQAVDAKTFLARGDNFSKKLKGDVARLTAEVESSKATLQQFSQFHKEAMERKDRELEATIRGLRQQKSAATREGDDEAAIELEDRIEVLQEERKVAKAAAKAEPPAVAPQENAVLEAWVEDGNEWFRDDPKLRAYAMAIGDELRASGDKSRDRIFLDKVAARMQEDFPNKFQANNPMRRRPGSVEGGGAGAGAGRGPAGGRSEHDLPAADRSLMRKFVSDGLMTKEQFLKDYNWN